VARELDLLATRYGQDPDGEPGSGEEFVTAVFAQVSGSVVTLGNCGHPPPLLVHGDHVRLLAASAPARPLGMGLGDEPPPLDAVTVPAGGRVLLYTDGLIEARDAAGRFFDLSEAAGVLGAGPLDAGVAALVRRLNAHAPGRVLDDVALVALEPLAPPPR
jgi:serine phosphatase RsbU (regulator of sigma subunit)